jgi:hypothetical protein
VAVCSSNCIGRTDGLLVPVPVIPGEVGVGTVGMSSSSSTGWKSATAFVATTRTSTEGRNSLMARKATMDAQAAESASASAVSQADEDETTNINSLILSSIAAACGKANEWREEMDAIQMGPSEVAFFALFSGIRDSHSDSSSSSGPKVLGLEGTPFYLTESEVLSALDTDNTDAASASPFKGFFTFEDLARAVQEDFLDAERGTSRTDNQQGWKTTAVSTPRGSSFDEARMTMDEINASLTQGTVIFNCIGAHIPQLAGAALACTDAASLPCAVNLYVTSAGATASAPPHTDRQDVVVVQTQGRKHWRVFSPPNPATNPMADMYARGKFQDNLPLDQLLESESPEFGCTLLLDVTLSPGDVLFIPAGFPHTTDTVNDSNDDNDDDNDNDTSLHLTFNLDTHVWDLDYLSARRLALQRAGVVDSALSAQDHDNRYVGNANLLPASIRNELFQALPLGLLDEISYTATQTEAMVDTISAELERISRLVDQGTADAVSSSVWRDTITRLLAHGMELVNAHRDMYISAVEEQQQRQEEGIAGIGSIMTPERMQRMSLFRVPPFFQQFSDSKESLATWAQECGITGSDGDGDGDAHNDAAVAVGGESQLQELPPNWEYTLPLTVGDEVEADLGGCMFEAYVTRVGPSFDVAFFDGDQEQGLERSMIKLVTPPPGYNL